MTRDDTELSEQVSDRPVLRLAGVHKTFPGGVVALGGIDLGLSKGEFVTLLGPSGSGKTTLLMVVSGFERADEGKLWSSGKDITDVPPEHRNFGVVFQNYALFPHMSVERNISYPLVVRNISRKQRRSLVQEMLALVGLEGLGSRRPGQLSGGQQQRVALARALVYRPSLLLLDEPLGALDRALRERMQIELRRLNRQVGATFLYVTHDQDEALTMSDRIAVMRNGRIEQVGSPEDIYGRPISTFVATFVGAANLLDGSVASLNGKTALIRLGQSTLMPTVQWPHHHLRTGLDVSVLVRPENMDLVDRATQPKAGEICVPGQVEGTAFTGNLWRFFVQTHVGRVEVESQSRPHWGVGDGIMVKWRVDDSWLIPKEK